MPSERLASDDPTGSGAGDLPADWWVFDVDGCLIDSLTGTSLRPGARDLLEYLARHGRRSILWSAGGGVRASPCRGVRDGPPRQRLLRQGRPRRRRPLHDVAPPHQDRHAIFVDDRPEDLARDLDVLVVSPYLSDDPHDRGLQRVARRAGLV